MSGLALFEALVERAMSHEWVWRIVIGLGIAVVGMWLARWLSRALDRLMVRLQVEVILRSFLRNLAYAIAVIVVLIAALDFAGVPTTSLLAVVGAAGLAIGLALKDSLSNIASGVMLIILRPFHAGDSVQIAGLEGVVDSVRIFQTRLHTADNRLIVLPNSAITGAPIINYTARGERRVDLEIGIGYGDDVQAARASLVAVARANPHVRPTPEPWAVVKDLGESRVVLQLSAWVPAQEFSTARAELLEAVLLRFREQGLRIPAQPRELHVYHPAAAPVGDASGHPSLLPPA